MIRELLFDDREAWAEALANAVAHRLRQALEDGRSASLAVPGGSTPVPVFHHLRRAAIAWERVRLTLTDERWVAPDHPDSNQGMVRRELLVGEAAQATLVPLTTDAPTPEAGCEESGRAIAALRPFDAVLLGMGSDGHVASLFPGVADLAMALDPTSTGSCIAARPATAGQPRLSLTLAALLDSRWLGLAITGQEKLAVFRRARESPSPATLPIAAVLRWASGDLEVFAGL